MDLSKHGEIADLLGQLIEAGQACEFTCSAPDDRAVCRVTLQSGLISTAPFLEALSQPGPNLTGPRVVWIGSTRYVLAADAWTRFLSSAEFEGITITLQTPREVTCVIGARGPILARLAADSLPPSLVPDPDSIVSRRLDRGRKVGRAAKDRWNLANATVTASRLLELEAAGEAVAFDAIHKDAVLPRKSLADLRTGGVAPAVAALWILSRRDLSVRPSRSQTARNAFATVVPAVFSKIQTAGSLATALAELASLKSVSDRPAEVIGARLARFVANIALPKAWWRLPLSVRKLEALEKLGDDAAWAAAEILLAGRRAPGSRAPIGMPTRANKPLAGMVRVGPSLPPADPETLVAECGLSGIELGNSLGARKGTQLIQLLAGALLDLRRVLGDWIVGLAKVGNLAVGLGARGHGRSLAHYEPGLRVINLTRTAGDGSLAHELGHFVDHMVASLGPKGPLDFLSENVSSTSAANGHPVVLAMGRVMNSIRNSSGHRLLTGDPAARRYFRPGWVLAAWELADQHRRQFREGRRARANSQTLADSLAKWTSTGITVNTAALGESDYFEEAKQLGDYWKRPRELFARAFESYVEDELLARGEANEFLVAGTRTDYSRCRGCPYAQGDERRLIGRAMAEFVARVSEHLG